MKAISRLSMFTVQTDSRELNDAPDIKVDTKKTVRRIATEIGYVPDRAGARLWTGKTDVIGLMLATNHNMMSNRSRLITSIDTLYQMIVTPNSRSVDRRTP